MPVPMYVVDILPESNTVVVGDEKAAYGRALLAEDVNFIAIPQLDGPMKVETKIEIQGQTCTGNYPANAPGGHHRVCGAPAGDYPGQSAVWYQGMWWLVGASSLRSWPGPAIAFLPCRHRRATLGT